MPSIVVRFVMQNPLRQSGMLDLVWICITLLLPTTEHHEMQAAQVHAIVASAYNLAAIDKPSLRERFPSGMRPADAREMLAAVQASFLELYRDSYAHAAGALYSPTDAQAAIDYVRFVMSPGAVVKFADPLDADETEARFMVTEYRAARPEIGDFAPDRVEVVCVCALPIPPRSVYLASDLVPA